MADGAVRRPPYQLARVFTAWAAHRHGYLRGRLILAGVDIDELDARSLIDVVEALFIEPALHGGTSIDDILDKVHRAMMELVPDRETHGLTPGAIAGAAAADAMFGQARPRT